MHWKGLSLNLMLINFFLTLAILWGSGGLVYHICPLIIGGSGWVRDLTPPWIGPLRERERDTCPEDYGWRKWFSVTLLLLYFSDGLASRAGPVQKVGSSLSHIFLGGQQCYAIHFSVRRFDRITPCDWNAWQNSRVANSHHLWTSVSDPHKFSCGSGSRIP